MHHWKKKCCSLNTKKHQFDHWWLMVCVGFIKITSTCSRIYDWIKGLGWVHHVWFTRVCLCPIPISPWTRNFNQTIFQEYFCVAIVAKSNQLASLAFFPPKFKIVHYFMNPISMKKPMQINDNIYFDFFA